MRHEPESRLASVRPLERTSPPTMHPLLDILAAMVREALAYEREFGREAA